MHLLQITEGYRAPLELCLVAALRVRGGESARHAPEAADLQPSQSQVQIGPGVATSCMRNRKNENSIKSN